jgi:hypothetical protein
MDTRKAEDATLRSPVVQRRKFSATSFAKSMGGYNTNNAVDFYRGRRSIFLQSIFE